MGQITHYHVFFLDVGQGESALIVKRLIDNGVVTCQTLLVDIKNGENLNVIDLIRDSIPKVNKDGEEVHFIDSMVITHPHDDHINGLGSLVNDTDILIGKIFHPDYDFIEDKDTVDYKAYNKLRKGSSKQPETRLIAGNSYGTDTGIVFTAISPPQTIENSQQFSEQPEKIQVHNQCAVISVDLNGTEILFLGDANKECMGRLMKYYKDKLPAKILSASHHGSNSIFVPEIEIEEHLSDVKRGDTESSWDEEFLDIINPDYVIISSGIGNKYNHPHDAALKAYQDNGRIVERTDKNGSLYFVVDDNGEYTDPICFADYDSVKQKIKDLFPESAKDNKSFASISIGASLPVPPRNA